MQHVLASRGTKGNLVAAAQKPGISREMSVVHIPLHAPAKQTLGSSPRQNTKKDVRYMSAINLEEDSPLKSALV